MTRSRSLARLLGGLLLAAPAALSAQSVVVVDPAGPVRTVTEALTRVTPGGRITVRAGTYAEPVIRVAVPVTIVGDSGAVFVGGAHEIFVVTADDVTIRGLTLRHVEPSYVEDRAAILFDSVANCVVEDSRLEGTFFGIYLSRSRGCRISRNVVQGTATAEMSAGNAIHLFHSREVTIDGNRVTGHRDGIYLEFARGRPGRRQREPGQPALRPPLHVLRPVRVPGQPVPSTTAPAWR